MKTATITKLAHDVREIWEHAIESKGFSRFFATLDRSRARVRRAIESGRVSEADAQAAWAAGYVRPDDAPQSYHAKHKLASV